MNWFVNNNNSNRFDWERADQCEHVEADKSTAVQETVEMDSFGPVGKTIMCQACVDAMHEEEDNEEFVCNDCGQVFLAKDGIEWTWFDYDERQGDEPLHVCDNCVNKEKHNLRVQRDSDDRDYELGYED